MLLEGDSRDYTSISSEDEYLNDSDKTDLVNMCENKYNIDRQKNQMQGRNPVQNSLYSMYSNTSIPNIRPYPNKSQLYENNSQKNLLDYLKEEARLESERINSKIYERKSFSPLYEKPLDVPEVKPKGKRGRKPKVIKPIEFSEETHSDSFEEQKSEERRKRTYRKRKQLSYEHPSEVSDHTNIESFADFADSMFTYKTKDKLKIYECPEPGCFTELPSLSRIKRHYLVHTNLKPFKCLNKNCDKRFSRKDNMIQHFRTHCNSKRNG